MNTHTSPVEFMLGLLFFGSIFIFMLIGSAIQSTKNYHVVIKGGAPYCPKCNRQVSYRRDHCRCCGYVFVSYGPTKEEQLQAKERERRASQAQVEREKMEARSRNEEAKRRKAMEAERQEARRIERERRKAYYLAKGITPGPFAWYFDLSEAGQAVLLILCCAIPSGIITFVLLRLIMF